MEILNEVDGDGRAQPVGKCNRSASDHFRDECEGNLAGAAGFEPPDAGFKNYQRPNIGAQTPFEIETAQEEVTFHKSGSRPPTGDDGRTDGLTSTITRCVSKTMGLGS